MGALGRGRYVTCPQAVRGHLDPNRSAKVRYLCRSGIQFRLVRCLLFFQPPEGGAESPVTADKTSGKKSLAGFRVRLGPVTDELR